MGRQVNFFLHPDDQQSFDLFLRSFNDICFLAYYNTSNKPTIVSDTIVRDHIKEGSRIHLIRKQDLKDLRFQYIEKFKYYLIDNTVSPVLDFDRCITRENVLSNGRLYFQSKLVENMQWREKDNDYIKWCDMILSKTRRYFKKYKYTYQQGSYEYTAFVSQKAMELITENRAEIGLAGDRLTIVK